MGVVTRSMSRLTKTGLKLRIVERHSNSSFQLSGSTDVEFVNFDSKRQGTVSESLEYTELLHLNSALETLDQKDLKTCDTSTKDPKPITFKDFLTNLSPACDKRPYTSLNKKTRIEESAKRSSVKKSVTFDDTLEQQLAGDPELICWLKNLSVHDNTITTLLEEELQLRDMLEVMNKEDLCNIRLKKGPELRIWNGIQHYRKHRRAERWASYG